MSRLKGFTLSEETKTKTSERMKGKTGDKHPAWKGGRIRTSRGYLLIYSPAHPYNSKGYVYEHRLVMEAHLGRILLPTEIIHHINEITDDNHYENLMLFDNDGKHRSYHRWHIKKESQCLT